MALSADRFTAKSPRGFRDFPVAANVTIYAGALVVVDTSGYARPGRASTTDKAVGHALTQVVNGAVAGAVTVKVDDTPAWYKNSASGDLIALTEIGDDIYVVDDEQVAKTSNSNARIIAGKCRNVDSTLGVLVAFSR
jgi:hypothetical protein